MKSYPTVVSRTLDPKEKSLVTVVGLHDHQLSDADVNLIQDLQDSKRYRLLNNQVPSGALTYKPLQFTPYNNSQFSVPAFDILFNGEVVTIGGNNSADLTNNVVNIPAPVFWTNGATTEPAKIYVVFLELWYASLDPTIPTGYSVDPNNNLFYYGNGCINADPANLIANDTIDPFEGVETTQRAQIQWAIRAQSTSLSYDFTKFAMGLDAGPDAATTVWAQAAQDAILNNTPFQFTNLGAITGDAGLWRSGDGNPLNDLGTLDGYSYAVPVAVVFQRNTGPFDVSINPFGCADSQVANSGVIQSQSSGRFDNKFADSIWSDDVVDTRQTISLAGWDFDKLMKQGFVDIITGNSALAISRGEAPGLLTSALGSQLEYSVSMSPSTIPNTEYLGSFDGFVNGFSSDERSFTTVKTLTVNQKSAGAAGTSWAQNDIFTITLPSFSKNLITACSVQALVTQSDGTFSPVTLLEGQLSIQGLETNTVTVKFLDDLSLTSYNPGQNNLYVSLEITQPRGTGVDLHKVPTTIVGGSLTDGLSGKTLPIYGVSEYSSQSNQVTLKNYNLWSINPEYSNLVFGTRVWVKLLGSQGTAQTQNGNTITAFTIPRNLEKNLVGLNAVVVWNLATGAFYTVSSRMVTAGSITFTLIEPIAPTDVIIASIICNNTCQVGYNSAVKGITSIEETVLFGTYTSDINFSMDGRINLVSQNATTLLFSTTDAVLKGISGDDVNQFVWTLTAGGVFTPVAVTSVNFSGALITVTVPSTLNLLTTPFFFIGSLLPSLSPASSMVVTERYVPYQGEGTSGRDYELVHSDETALVTTNGTGLAPTPGLQDVHPYDRDFPIVTSLPAQADWNDSDLQNSAVQSFFDSNYVAKAFNSVEHTFNVPVHTNDFIEPVSSDKRKLVRMSVETGGRGYAKATPHIGFAISPLLAKSSSISNALATNSPIILYVDNVKGSDVNDGLSPQTAFLSIAGAVSSLPSILRHPCVVQLIYSGINYSLQNLDTIILGDGTIRQSKYYALANIAFTVQESGRLVISSQAGSTSNIVIDAASYVAPGDGPTSAFFVENTRVIFNNITFQNFTDSPIFGVDSDIEMVDCNFINNITSGSFSQSCNVVMSGGGITLTSGNGMILANSDLLVSGVSFTVAQGGVPGNFFTAERSSSLTLQTHSLSMDTNVLGTTSIAAASVSSSIICAIDFTTAGTASLKMLSALSRTVSINPFVGGVSADTSSVVQTSV
jgi:hypothetical protein